MALIPSRSAKSKSGRTVILRNPTDKDAEPLVAYGQMAASETRCMVTLPSELAMTVEDELKWIAKLNGAPNSLAIIAEVDGRIAGLLDFHGKPREKLKHTGAFGMALYPEFRNEGIGQLLLETLIEWANHHPVIRKISLAVFSTNTPAVQLYKKMGFVEEGRRIREVQVSPGEFVDDILMYRWLEAKP